MSRIWLPAMPAVITVLLALGAVPAAAQGTAQQRADCTGDAFRFCLTDIPNVDRIEACLLRNKAQLSPACQRDFAVNPPGKKRRTP
jgi:hypothetical protein